MEDLVSYINLAMNSAMVILGWKLVRHLTRMEMRVAMMWSEFKRRNHIRDDDSDHGFELS